MTDRAYDPADANPFDQFDPDKVGALPANQNKKPDDPFEEFNPFPGQGIKAQPDQSSTTGAFARGAERSIVPALGSIPAIGAGAEVGAAVGAAGGPLAPITVPVGALIGGVVGGFGGSYLLSQAQNYVLSKAPDSWKEKIGLDDRQEKLDEQEHPYASFLGGLTPYALTMRPGLATTTKLPENATALQRILAHPATARVFGGAAMGGMELGQEAASGQTPDWTKVAVSTGFGLVFNTPTRIGESLTEIGARPTRTLLGRPQPVPAATAPPTVQQPTEAPQEAQPATELRPAPPQGVAATLFHAPTVAQASDLNVMGPGVTKEVFEGAHERNPGAAMTAQDAARTETLVTQTTPSLPDIHQVARRMDPDLFDQYQEINQRRNTLQEWVTSEGTENAPVAAGHLATLNGELAELEPKIAAAYRRAAEASGHPTVEPQPVSESWGLFPPPEVRPSAPIDAETGIIGTAPRSIEAQKQFIAADVAKQLTAAGRPSEEAEAAGKLVAARYEARAARMGGRLGTAQELYEREGALIRGPKGPAAPPPAAPPTVAPTPAAEVPPLAERAPAEQWDAFVAARQEREQTANIATGYNDQRTKTGAPIRRRATQVWTPGNVVDVGFVKDLLITKKNSDGTYTLIAKPDANGISKSYNAEPQKGLVGDKPVSFKEATTPLYEPEPEIAVGPKAARGPRAVPQERWSLLQFLTDRGGIRPDDKNIGDVKQSFGGKNHFEPGFGQLIRPGGMTLDRAREAAVEAGYLQDLGQTGVKAGEATSNLDTLLQAIDKEARGTKVYRQGIEPADAKVRDIDEAEAERHRAEQAEVDTIVNDYLKDIGQTTRDIEPHIMARTRELIARQRLEPSKAHEQAIMETDEHAVETKGYPERAEHIPGWDVPLPDDAAGAQEASEATAEGGPEVGASTRANRENYREKTWTEFYQRKRERDLIAEREAEGQQQIPGAERISDAERAQRTANQPLRPTAEQKPMDEGLFGDEKNQGELFQLAKVMHDTEVDERDNGNVFIRSKDDPDDSLSLWVGRHAVYSRLASVLKSNRGQGIGTALYERAIKYADEKGLPLRSDINVTSDGMRVYDALKRRGYEVIEAPDSRKSALGITNGMAGYVYEVRLPTEKRELFQQARGGIVLNPNAVPGHDYIGMENVKPLLRITSEGNASTFIHESGHQYLAELVRDASHEAAPQDLKDDLKTVTDWLGLKGPEDLKLYPESNRVSKISATKAHEKFARGFEQYLREGVAPSQELAGVFAKFKNWLLGIYRTIKGLGSPINDDVKRVFDRLLTTEPQKTVIAPERTVRPTLADIHVVDARETPPNEAEPRGDMVNNEADRYIAEPHAEIAHEIQARTAEVQAEQAATAGTAAEPPGEARPDQDGSAVLGTGGGGTEPVAPGGGVGEGRGTVEEGGGGPVREGNEHPSGERGPQPANATRDQPLAPNPAASLGARESPFLDKAGNIRLENLTNDQDVREAIRDAASENDDFIGDRRGVVTDGQVQDLANDLGMEGAEALVKKHVVGQAYNAEQVWAVRKLLIQSATEVSAAMKKAAIGTDEDLMAYAIAKDRHQLIQATVAGITAEAGRALRAFRTMAGEEGAQATNEFIKQATGKTLFQLKMEAKLGAQLDSPAKISKFLNDARDRSFGGMVLEYWINGLISGIATHVTYVQGNIILALEKAGPETAIAAALGAARRAGGRPGEVVHIGEVGAQLKGAIRGLPGAAEAFLEAMRSGQTTLLPGEQARPLMPFSGDTSLAVAKSMTDNPVAWREVGAQAFSMIRGIRDGFVAGAALLKAGGIEGAPLIGANYSTLGQIPDLAVRGVTVLPVGSTIRVPGRSVAAIHSFFRSLIYSMNKSAEAFRTASEEGLTGNAFDSRVGDIWQNPTPEIMERSRETATQLTLMGQGGEFVKALSKLTNATLDLPVIGKIAPLKFIDPFVHIGANIIKQAIVERTPVGILSPEIRADLMGKNGNIAQDMASARMIAGTSMALLFGGLAMEGYASGSGPSDPRQSAMWRLAGNQAHSVRIGDIWYQVNRLGPMGMLMSTAADFYDVAHEAAQGDVLMAASHIQHAITQNILDESFMRGPADLIKAVEDPGRYGEGYIKNFLSSFVPFSVGMAQMARASDPYSRQARTVMDSIKAKVPGLSETLLPRRDIWGEEMPSYEALGHAGVTAIYETRVNRDPVNQAMLQLGIYPAQPIRKIRNVDLTDQQYDDYSRISGRMTKMRLDAIVKSPDWQTWPNHIKHDVISEVIRQSREAASGVMMAKFPQIPADATAFKMKKLQD